MDTSYEDKMYRQIEKSLSDNMNDRLLVPIEMIDEDIYKGRRKKRVIESVSNDETAIQEEPKYIDGSRVYNDRTNTSIDMNPEEGTRLSRAEYIRLAREACLRQMNTLDTPGIIRDVNIGEVDYDHSTNSNRKRDKVQRLFYEGSEEENLSEEIASFRSLTIRTVCAVVIFISIFIIDKVKVDWGPFSYETIRQYVTGNNQLKALEEIIVSLLK